MNRPPRLSNLRRLRRPLLLGLIMLASALPVRAQEGVMLNLKDADLGSLIETVAEVTGTNFVVDPRVKAKITVISAKPMNEDEVYQVFLSVLQVHGYAAVPVGEIVKIVPDITAKQGPAELTDSGQGDELITRVINVDSISAAQLVPILRPLVPQQGHLAAYTANNTLVISDRAANIDRIQQIVERMDYPVSDTIEVIRMEHAAASEIVRVITAMQQRDTQLAGGQLPGQPLLVADDRTNSILLSGQEKARLRMRGLIAHLDTPLETGGDTQVVFLNYAKAEDLAPILLGVAEQQQEQAAAGESQSAIATTTTTSTSSSSDENEELDIQADERNNALVITAPPDEFANIQSVIRQLDIRRAQVLVEAIIAEVSTTLANQLGFQFAVVPEDADGTPLIASSLSGAGRTLTQIISNPLGLGNGLLLGAADLSGGGTRFGLILQALASDAATNILSTPTLVTLDNEEAEVVVAQNVPFVTGNFTTGVDTGQTTGGVDPFQTIERQDVGITLRITPQVNEGDTIRLDIEQESSSIAETNIENATDLITNKRTIKTNVLVEDGQTLVLGGLIEDSVTDNQQKVPILGDIPLLGYLFRSDSTNEAKRSLMVFIHPVILRDPKLATAYTNSKYDYLRARQFEANQRRGFGKVSAARLPELDELITQIPKSIRQHDRLMEMTPDVGGEFQ